MSEEIKKDVHTSRVFKGRKSIDYLQRCKQEGKKLVQMCPGPRDQYWVMAAEMVDFDTFNMMPKAASHAKAYGDFFQFAVKAYSGWAEDVRSGGYPEDTHGYHMNEREFETFMNELDKKYPDIKKD